MIQFINIRFLVKYWWKMKLLYIVVKYFHLSFRCKWVKWAITLQLPFTSTLLKHIKDLEQWYAKSQRICLKLPWKLYKSCRIYIESKWIRFNSDKFLRLCHSTTKMLQASIDGKDKQQEILCYYYFYSIFILFIKIGTCVIYDKNL